MQSVELSRVVMVVEAAAALLAVGYLCTRSLISLIQFCRLSNAGLQLRPLSPAPPAEEALTSCRLSSSFPTASRKANLFLIWGMQST